MTKNNFNNQPQTKVLPTMDKKRSSGAAKDKNNKEDSNKRRKIDGASTTPAQPMVLSSPSSSNKDLEAGVDDDWAVDDIDQEHTEDVLGEEERMQRDFERGDWDVDAVSENGKEGEDEEEEEGRRGGDESRTAAPRQQPGTSRVDRLRAQIAQHRVDATFHQRKMQQALEAAEGLQSALDEVLEERAVDLAGEDDGDQRGRRNARDGGVGGERNGEDTIQGKRTGRDPS
jgi:hypothetical protein